ncbi:hypothetical protein D7X33_08070 [Butyricicoccus sp. 1XD8-22]|nr:hypothetical protein D7X33_08070 [Butyricicoccus sp. 1XD8-22]
MAAAPIPAIEQIDLEKLLVMITPAAFSHSAAKSPSAGTIIAEKRYHNTQRGRTSLLPFVLFAQDFVNLTDYRLKLKIDHDIISATNPGLMRR